MNDLIQAGTTPAFVAQGRWVARCGYPFRCSAAVDLGPFQSGFFCPECGGGTEIIWPSASMVDGIRRLLLMRPHPYNRNWLPGETLIDLMAQNAEHGVFTNLEVPPGVCALTVAETAIRVDALPLGPARPALTGGR